LNRLGISAQQLFSWASFGFDAPGEQQIAQEIQNTAKSKYDDTTWVTVGKPLNDSVRANSKAALISYILSPPASANWTALNMPDGTPVTTSDQLYEYFLIDVDMSPCMLTSRIVQACAAVQLFVQRCLMNLEPQVTLTISAATEWKEWRQNFRVWQAAQQVLHYPEDWMVPALRDDKTPFFQDLENTLLQNPLTTENIEQAYLNYLYALNDVALLDVRGTYWQLDPNSAPASDFTPDAVNDVLHVFARTTAQPYRYYYRHLLNCSQFNVSGGGSIWTPWEKVGVDIQADHLVPVVWDGRLFVFWPTFTESSEPTAQGNVPVPPVSSQAGSATAQPPLKDLSITLNWSEYCRGTWSSKETSSATLTPQFWNTYSEPLPTSTFAFNAVIDNNDNLLIDLYWLNKGPPEQQGVLKYNPVGVGRFTFSGCQSAPSPESALFFEGGVFPENTVLQFNSLAEWDMGGAGGQGSAYGGELVLVSGSSTYPRPPDTDITVLQSTPSPYTLMFPHQFFPNLGLEPPAPFPDEPFFFQDGRRSYFVTELYSNDVSSLADANTESARYNRVQLSQAPAAVAQSSIFPGTAIGTTTSAKHTFVASRVTAAIAANGAPGTPVHRTVATGSAQNTDPPDSAPIAGPTTPPSQIVFSIFFHPFVCSLIKTLNQYGLANLLSLDNQALTNDGGVIAGFELHPSSKSYTPGMDPGLLIAQGQFYQSETAPAPDPGPVPQLGVSYLYYNAAPGNGFYYNAQQTPSTPGDAYLGSVEALHILAHGVIVQVTGPTVFEATYGPNTSYVFPDTFPRENLDFSFTGAYSTYNHELFVHIPWFIATRLSQDHQFAEAQKWFHYIFNPTITSTDPIPQRYWRCLPFYECSPWDHVEGQIQNLLYPPPNGSAPRARCGQDISEQIAAWVANPFDPFLIGRMRPIAFRMKVVMAYLDNLIAWGDSLFRQNTRESINEATQIYVLAKDILGPRPEQIPERGVIQDYTYNDLKTLYGIDKSSNAVVQMENEFPYLSAANGKASSGLGATIEMSSVIPYFCFPPNTNLLAYWDTVDDRLYKIRHCMNIQGVIEQLPLFAPPISPALLVAAAAAGVDLSSVLSNTNAVTPFYKFPIIVQKALDLCGEVGKLGAALVAALEKKDAEDLALLRATQETSLLHAMQNMKQYAVEEAQDTVAGLKASLQTATDRQAYYQGLINDTSSPAYTQEANQATALQSASSYQSSADFPLTMAGIYSLLPEFQMGINGAGGSPSATLSMGGSQYISQANAAAARNQASAGYQSYLASSAGLQAQWGRRTAEWNFQAAQAADQIAEIRSQIDAANFRVQIAQEDQKNLNSQIQNAQAVQDFLTGKYTNTQLYSWMVDQISTVFFQCYQMAYGWAVLAEAGFRFARGLTTSSYIQFGYWDSLKKGLMSAERLYADLKRMELAYLETDVRDYEIAKSISLVLFDPWALITLKQTGRCQINLPEAFFDMDYPGHYFRRLKTVSLTIPCVTGPYTSVNCTLTLLNSKIRVDGTASSKQDYASDAHFITNYAATQSIATSTAQNDSGLFEVNFRDERYLPFEGAGLISTWQIDLPPECNAFPMDTITDVILNVQYMSRPGDARLREWAKQVAVLPVRPVQSANGSNTSIPTQTNLQRMFSLRHEFSTEWYKFLHPADTATAQSMTITLRNERFPFQYRNKTIKISQAEIILVFSTPQFQANYASGGPISLYLGPPVAGPPPNANVSLASNQQLLGGAGYKLLPSPGKPTPPGPGAPPSWILQAQGTAVAAINPSLQNNFTSGGVTYYHLNPAAIDDIFLICRFTAS
jgi:hypothetical protein